MLVLTKMSVKQPFLADERWYFNYIFFRIPFLKSHFQLEDNCFTELSGFQPYNNANQSQVYLCLLPLEPPSHPLSKIFISLMIRITVIYFLALESSILV